jgi:hypothetical protein
LRYTPGPNDLLTGWDWSPDGRQVALLVYDRTARSSETVTLPGGRVVKRAVYDCRVLVADADGGNAKEVYKKKGSSVKTFMWK